jgi:hypothetical protein
MLIIWSINATTEGLHYSNKLSATSERFYYAVKHDTNLIENFKRGTSSPVCQKFLMTNFLINLVGKPNFKLLTAAKIGQRGMGAKYSKKQKVKK